MNKKDIKEPALMKACEFVMSKKGKKIIQDHVDKYMSKKSNVSSNMSSQPKLECDCNCHCYASPCSSPHSYFCIHCRPKSEEVKVFAPHISKYCIPKSKVREIVASNWSCIGYNQALDDILEEIK